MIMTKRMLIVFALLAVGAFGAKAGAQETADNTILQALDVFQLEYASDPQISPDGKQIVYVRNFMDIMTDRKRSNLWIIDYEGTNHRPLTTGNENDSSPRWSPSGDRLLFSSNMDETGQLYVRWMDTGQTAKLTNLTGGAGGAAWSPDGKWIAFSMKVPEADKPFISMPPKPKGAEWAKPAKVITRLKYRADGAGYITSGYTQIFVLSAEGGAPRQITSGPYNHGGSLSWAPDGESIVFSSNRHDDWEYESNNSEVYEVSLANGAIKPLTKRNGPDNSPTVSPNGKLIAYLGFDDRVQGHQTTHLYVMNRDGSNSRMLLEDLDRGISSLNWNQESKGLYYKYDDQGDTKIGLITLQGKTQVLASGLGGTSLGRPYSSGSYSVSGNARFAYTLGNSQRPADVATGRRGPTRAKPITALNEDLLGHKQLGKVEEIWYESTFDQRKIQGWIVKPPNFNPAKKYPLLLEIHGGPFSMYCGNFAAEIQLFAAAGYVVLYTNPRGSTGYGEEFGNLIHHNYPGEDYNDLMDGVDAVIARGYVDEESLYVTGGSGGGVLSSWIVGMTPRFRAAVVVKPVINWYSFVLTSDSYSFYYKYWFPGFPWENLEHYMKRSPLSLVGNVVTPTMLMTGEADYRTPMSETEQYYQALKLRKIDTALVRIPDASHGIATRPSNLIAKVAHILKWFEIHQK